MFDSEVCRLSRNKFCRTVFLRMTMSPRRDAGLSDLYHHHHVLRLLRPSGVIMTIATLQNIHHALTLPNLQGSEQPWSLSCWCLTASKEEKRSQTGAKTLCLAALSYDNKPHLLTIVRCIRWLPRSSKNTSAVRFRYLHPPNGCIFHLETKGRAHWTAKVHQFCPKSEVSAVSQLTIARPASPPLHHAELSQ